MLIHAMNLGRSQHFVAFADAASLGRTARLSGLGQPALSKSIAMLEEDLGLGLLDRRGSFELTALGLQVLEPVRKFVDANLLNAGMPCGMVEVPVPGPARPAWSAGSIKD